MAKNFRERVREALGFGSPAPDPEPKPALPDLEPIDFPEPGAGGKPPDVVVDFGTTATVACLIDVVYDAGGRQEIRPTFLAGETEHPSEMTVNENGEVSRVGAEAFGDWLNTKNRYYTSLKRYLELESRGGTQQMMRQGVTFADIVNGYLQESISKPYERSKRKVGPNSRVVISIPNSFNPTAVEDVRQGVIKAITALNGQSNPINPANVRIARESEAIGYLYRRGTGSRAPASGHDTKWERIEWEDLSGGGCVTPSPGAERVVVLDVGGGTTDLSLLDTTEETQDGQNGIRIHVVMNAGMPLGGTDVDRLLLRSAIGPEFKSAEALAELKIENRHDLLRLIRAAKEEDATRFFNDPAESESDDLLPVLERIMKGLGANLRRSAATDETARAFREEANRRIETLTRLSVTGLFDLIPPEDRAGIKTILLTGRASKLEQVQDAVLEQASKLNADVQVLSLKHSYHLKLAVAYGCALVRNEEFSGDKLPSGTLGRQLRLFGGARRPAMEFDGTLPVSGMAPTLWEITCSRKNQTTRYEVWEYSVSLPLEFLTDPEHTVDQMIGLGCCRPVAAWPVYSSGPEPYRKLLLARHPATEAYYVVDGAESPKWEIPENISFDATDINLVTGLPLGFPYEVLS